MGRFTGKTAVITGSGRRKGLGEAIAKRLAEDGANIVISDIGAPRDEATGAEHIGSTDEMESIAADMRALGVQSSTKVCDVRSLEDVRGLAQHAVELDRLAAGWATDGLAVVLAADRSEA